MSTEPDPVDEFRQMLNDAAAAFGLARSALTPMRRDLQRFAELAGLGPDQLLHMSIFEDAPRSGPSDAFAAWPYKDLPTALSQDGPVARQIGHQWLVHVYHLWENDYRGRIAARRGLNHGDDLKNSHMGDLGLMRHDVLKHRGIATRKNSGRCKVLRWFSPGDQMIIRDPMVYSFMEAFGLTYPAIGGETPIERIQYQFHGQVNSPVQLTAIDDGHTLQGELRRISGLPLDIAKFRARFVGLSCTIDWSGDEETAVGVDVSPHPTDPSRATIRFRTSDTFASQVRSGARTARWPVGVEIPNVEHKRAVQVRWVRPNLLVAEAIAPEGKWYDPNDFKASFGEALPLVSSIGDLHEAVLLGAQWGPDGQRQLQLYLEARAELSDAIRSQRIVAYLPLTLPLE